jgi:hypothetical protein
MDLIRPLMLRFPSVEVLFYGPYSGIDSMLRCSDWSTEGESVALDDVGEHTGRGSLEYPAQRIGEGGMFRINRSGLPWALD